MIWYDIATFITLTLRDKVLINIAIKNLRNLLQASLRHQGTANESLLQEILQIVQTGQGAARSCQAVREVALFVIAVASVGGRKSICPMRLKIGSPLCRLGCEDMFVSDEDIGRTIAHLDCLGFEEAMLNFKGFSRSDTPFGRP